MTHPGELSVFVHAQYLGSGSREPEAGYNFPGLLAIVLTSVSVSVPQFSANDRPLCTTATLPLPTLPHYRLLLAALPHYRITALSRSRDSAVLQG